jgi:adenine-specific DNA-methyltransferase
MKLHIKQPSQALNAAFLKVKPIRAEFDKFKDNLKTLLSGIVPAESEEFHKNLISLFLRETYLGNRYYINTNNKTDLVIHTGESANSNVGVLIETKRPKPTTEMLAMIGKLPKN